MPKILIAEDNEDMLDTLEQIFKHHNFEVDTALNGREAIERAAKDPPDLILLDANMPVMNGFDSCKILKSQKLTKDIPVIFLSANFTEVNDRITGFELGADDYILKPFNIKELIMRSTAILQRYKTIKMLQQENKQLTDSNQRMLQELNNLAERTKSDDGKAIFDQLTGLYKRPFFEMRLRDEFDYARENGLPLSVIVLSIGKLDYLNQHLGPHISNYIFIKMANILLQRTRSIDTLCRYNEDAIAILLPDTDEHSSYLKAEQIRASLNNAEYIDDELVNTFGVKHARKSNVHKNITVNLGISTFSSDSKEISDSSELLKNTVEALRVSISLGSNKTIASDTLKNDE
jgi:diguanylate cyclase (GGDEF)-like protein